MTLIDYLILLTVAVWFVAALVSIILRHRRGEGCCGTSGSSCSGCSGCASCSGGMSDGGGSSGGGSSGDSGKNNCPHCKHK